LGKQWLQIDHLKQKTMYVFGVAAWTKIGMGDARYDHATTDQCKWVSLVENISFISENLQFLVFPQSD
jgi:hypothetical protein